MLRFCQLCEITSEIKNGVIWVSNRNNFIFLFKYQASWRAISCWVFLSTKRDVSERFPSTRNSKLKRMRHHSRWPTLCLLKKLRTSTTKDTFVHMDDFFIIFYERYELSLSTSDDDARPSLTETLLMRNFILWKRLLNSKYRCRKHRSTIGKRF